MSRNEINELRRSRSELAANGRNLNQIAKAMNTDSQTHGPSAETIAALLRAVNGHKEAVTALVHTVELRSQQ